MPYGDDRELLKREREYDLAVIRVAAANDLGLRARLSAMRCPPDFLDLPVWIWWHGKED